VNKVVAEEKARFVVKMVSRGTVSKDRFEKKNTGVAPESECPLCDLGGKDWSSEPYLKALTLQGGPRHDVSY
jgi:hypothetical protein